MVRPDSSALSVRLAPSWRHAVRADPRRKPEIVIKGAVLLAIEHDVLDRELALATPAPSRGWRGRRQRSEDSRCAYCPCTLESIPAGQPPRTNHTCASHA